MSAVNGTLVLEIEGHKVAVIGYVTTDTDIISSPDPTLSFTDVIETIQDECTRLRDEGVEIIIAMGHNGYVQDLSMAEQIPDLDVVVGGHSHSFLYTGTPTSIENVEGPYPTYVKQSSGKVVPVVQAFYYTKYMGRFKVNFNTTTGDLLLPVDGHGVDDSEVILLDGGIEKDPWVDSLLDKYRDQMEEYYEVVGFTDVPLTRFDQRESNMANAVTDAMAAAWEEVNIAFTNSGSIRSELPVGEITGEDIFSVLPFNNTIDKVYINGTGLKWLLEQYAGQLCSNASCDAQTFLQMSGIRVVYDILDNNIDDRVTEAKVKCPGDEDNWCDLEEDAVYPVAIPDFLAEGGAYRRGQREFFPDVMINRTIGGPDFDVFRDYIKQETPLTTLVEDRIVIYYGDATTTTTTTNTTT
jgi:2',3'-cyclic-nucleotide 2'-phosphodiesterase (5'-nucleotidase family)